MKSKDLNDVIRRMKLMLEAAELGLAREILFDPERARSLQDQGILPSQFAHPKVRMLFSFQLGENPIIPKEMQEIPFQLSHAGFDQDDLDEILAGESLNWDCPGYRLGPRGPAFAWVSIRQAIDIMDNVRFEVDARVQPPEAQILGNLDLIAPHISSLRHRLEERKISVEAVHEGLLILEKLAWAEKKKEKESDFQK
jgi:hypothetical protein